MDGCHGSTHSSTSNCCFLEGLSESFTYESHNAETQIEGDSVMVGLVVVTRAALLIARRASTWTIEEHLGGRFARVCGGRPAQPGSNVLRKCACRSLRKRRQRAELGTSR